MLIFLIPQLKGKLVTAKYIPIEKYYKWFPLAATAQKHITPST